VGRAQGTGRNPVFERTGSRKLRYIPRHMSIFSCSGCDLGACSCYSSQRSSRKWQNQKKFRLDNRTHRRRKNFTYPPRVAGCRVSAKSIYEEFSCFERDDSSSEARGRKAPLTISTDAKIQWSSVRGTSNHTISNHKWNVTSSWGWMSESRSMRLLGAADANEVAMWLAWVRLREFAPFRFT
jgi:hypothetical protein